MIEFTTVTITPSFPESDIPRELVQRIAKDFAESAEQALEEMMLTGRGAIEVSYPQDAAVLGILSRCTV